MKIAAQKLDGYFLGLTCYRGRLYVCLITSLILMVSCQDSEWTNGMRLSNYKKVGNKNTGCRSIDEALEFADEWFKLMNCPTRSSGRKVAEIQYLQMPSNTRSNTNDTLLYLVNYSNNSGFALLGSRYSSKEIYAISEQGRLLMSDTIYNKPLGSFISRALEDANTSSDTWGNIILPPTPEPDWEYIILGDVEAMLPNFVSEWGQGEPYNEYCPDVEGEKGFIGCCPLAVAMMMTYYKYPSKVGDVALNWSEIYKKKSPSFASMIAETIAGSNFLNSTYQNDTVSGSPKYQKLGYIGK